MLCSHELQVLLDRRLHISEGPLADPKSARLSVRGARPQESPAWVEDVVARRKAELEEFDSLKATEEHACLLQHVKDKLASESVHVQELSQKLEEQQVGREIDAAHALTQRVFLHGEYEEYGACKHGLAELEMEFQEEYAIYQARSRSLKEWQTEFSTECAEFRTRNRSLMESQSQLQDECRAYGAHCCNLVDMQDSLRSELDEYRVRNQSLARWQGRFEQECEEFGARNRDLREWQTKFAEESQECAARNQDLAQKQTSFADECAEFKTRNRSLAEWQSKFADEYTEYKTLNRSIAKLHEELQESTSQEQDFQEVGMCACNSHMRESRAPETFYEESFVASLTSPCQIRQTVAPHKQQDADNQDSSAEGLLRRALACNTVPLQDVRSAIGCLEVLLQESKLEMAAQALSEKREAAQKASIAGKNATPALVDMKELLQSDGQSCLEVVLEKRFPGRIVGFTSSAPSVLEDQEHCNGPASVAFSTHKQVCAAPSMEAIETHLPDFEMLTPIAPPISKCADACSTVKLGMPPPSLAMEAAILPFSTAAAAVLPGTPRMIVKRLPSTPSEPE